MRDSDVTLAWSPLSIDRIPLLMRPYYCFQSVYNKQYLYPTMNLSPDPPHEHRHRHRHRSHSPYSTKIASDGNDQERTDYIIDTFVRNFGPQMKQNPKAWRGRFRKMASNEFAFYRGSAVLFYRDLQHDLGRDRWLKACPEASNIFIHVGSSRSPATWFMIFTLGWSSRREFRHVYRSIWVDQFWCEWFRWGMTSARLKPLTVLM